MPIPLLIWGAVAAGAGIIAWKNRKKIKDYFDSEEGQELLKGFGKAYQGMTAPQRKMLEDCFYKTSGDRILYFQEAKERLSTIEWSLLVSEGQSLAREDPQYLAVVMDLLEVDRS